MLAHVHRDGALTRAELTQRLGVSRSTVGALVADLSQLGLVEEVVPSGGAGVGRPSHVVTPNRGGPYAIAIDVDVEYMTIALVGLGGTVLAREVVGTVTGATVPDALAHVAVDAIARLSAACPNARPAGIGVSIPGTVDRRTGRVAVAPNLGWRDAEFGRLIDALSPEGVPVHVGNDADLAVLAEHRRGNARDCDDVVFLIGRTGIGAGIIVGGTPLRGHDGYAGEIGHNVIDPSGPECHCGKRGCVETYIGSAALLARAGRAGAVGEEAVGEVFDAARAGDALALAAVRGVAEPLGWAIAGLVNTLNPERVLLGGTLAHVLDIAKPQIEQAVRHYALEATAGSVQLVAPAFGADSALLGAAEIAFAELLADPLSTAAHSV